MKKEQSAISSPGKSNGRLLGLGRSTVCDGWGVFALKDICQGSLIQVTPLFLTFPDPIPLLSETLLDHYQYEYVDPQHYSWKTNPSSSAVLPLGGYLLVVNHVSPASLANVRTIQMGAEPVLSCDTAQDDDTPSGVCIGLVATRFIPAGHELWNHYSSTWFADRGLTEGKAPLTGLVSRPKVLDDYLRWESPSRERLEHSMRFGTSWDADEADGEKLLSAGIILDAFLSDIQSTQPGYVTCIEPRHANDTIAQWPAMILPFRLVQGTLLESLCFSWEDVGYDGKNVPSKLPIFCQSAETDWEPSTEYLPRSETCIFPFCGLVPLLARTKNEDISNARLRVHWEDGGSVLLELVASCALAAGAKVIVAPGNSTSSNALAGLIDHCITTGQSPLPEWWFP